jgi:hypothetical protein
MLNEKENDAGLLAYYDLLRRTPGAVSMFCHPGDYFGNFSDFDHADRLTLQRVTLIEVGNGDGEISDEGRGYYRTHRQYNLALDKGWYVAPVMSQDNHHGAWGDANSLRTAILAPALTPAHLQQALLDRRVYATEAEGLEIVYTANHHLLGSIVDELPPYIDFRADIKNQNADNRIKSVCVVTNGGTQMLTARPGTRDYVYKARLTEPAAGWYYLRVEVDTPQGLRYAYTAPVWFGASTDDTTR